MYISVYNGDGTEAVDVLLKSLTNALLLLSLQDKYQIRTVLPNVLHQPDWLLDTALLIIPGGRDTPYVRDLKGRGVANIKAYVNNGGSYLGLCAGAYFSSSYVLFEVGTPLEVKGARPLKFFQGIANGSVYPGYAYNSTRGARVATINLTAEFEPKLGETLGIYFNGGCEFIPYKDFNDFNVIAHYNASEKIAVVSMRKGRVILSGVHPEMDVNYLDPSRYTTEQWDDMCKHAKDGRHMLAWLVKQLLGESEVQTVVSRL